MAPAAGYPPTVVNLLLGGTMTAFVGEGSTPLASGDSDVASSPVPMGASRLQRRVVTVLFADLVGFTGLAEALEPEDVAEVQERYFAACRDVLLARDAQVEKFIGDAVVASFGLPRSREDDAARAVDSGLAIVEAVERLAVELGAPSEMAVRVGVNTGEVAVTDEEGVWRLTGDAVNVAARLQSMATPGSVLVGADTALAADRHFHFEPVGDVPLKGKAMAQPVWAATGPRPDIPSRTATPLVGRTRLLDRLSDGVAAAGAAKPWVLMAPPGVGKSRLVTELASRLAARGVSPRVVHAERQAVSAYQPIADLMKLAMADRGLTPEGLVGTTGDDAVSRRVLADHLRGLLDGKRLTDPPEALHASWIRLLVEAEAGEKAAWMIEDLHFAGADLFAFLAAAADSLGSALVLTTRPVAAGAGQWPPPGATTVVHLEPLTPADTRRLVDHLVGRDALSDSTIQSIVDASGGNPLFVEELVRSWIHTGRLVLLPGGRYQLVGPVDARLPTTVRAVYLGLLDDLPAESRSVATSGAVAGITFPSSALRRLGITDASGGLDYLTGAGLLSGPHPDGLDVRSFSYRHALMRDTAYDTLPRTRRAVLHLRYARWLEGLGDPDPIAELIGLHLAAAHQAAPIFADSDIEGTTPAQLAGEAAAWLEVAARRAADAEPERTVELWAKVVSLTPVDVPASVPRRLELAEALRRAGRLPDALDEFEMAGRLAGRHGDTASLADAAIGFEEALFASRLDRAVWGRAGHRLLDEALAAVDSAGTRARLLASCGRASAYEGDPRAAALASEAVELARKEGDDGSLVFALRAGRALLEGPADLARRLEESSELVAAAARLPDLEGRVEAGRLHVVDLLQAGHPDSHRARRGVADLIFDLGRPLYLWYPPMWEAMDAVLEGRHDEAPALIDEFERAGERWHFGGAREVATVQRLHLAVQRGDPEAALEEVDHHVPLNPSSWSAVRAYVHALTGDTTLAAALFSELAADRFARIPDDLARSYVVSLLIEVASLIGAADDAATLETMLEPWSGQNLVVGSGALCLGAVDHYVATAALMRGDRDRAAALWKAAIGLDERIGAVPATTVSRNALAAMSGGDTASRMVS